MESPNFAARLDLQAETPPKLGVAGEERADELYSYCLAAW
jgi:hypothetical protein